MPLGGVPSPSFPQQSFQAQQANQRPSSAGEMYNNSNNGYSPPLPHPVSFQPQHRHSLPHGSYMAPNSYPPLHTPTSLPNTPSILAATSRPNTAGASAMSSLTLDPGSVGAFRPTSAPPPSDSITAALHLASQNRALYHSGSPVLAYNPAREPSAPTKAIVHRGGVKYAVGTSNLSGKGASGGVVVGTSKAKLAELQASCYSCGTASAKLILRGNDVEFGPRAEFTCLRCLPTDSAGTGSSNVGDVEDQHYSDTMSAAVDQLEGHPVRRTRIITPEQTAKHLPAEYKRQGMICDVCDRVIGAGTIKSSYPGPPPAFTTEIICYPCLEKYKPCSDCGGGGGRLTPGRWRCKELFPAGRRTCQLSHARNPPLADIEYDVLSVREVDQEKLEYLTRRCREVYVNTRLRTAARPEMLERADGLATTWDEAEKMTIDQWHLLVPMLYEDIEPTRSIRRYIAYHSSTPHRRRAKPKVKVDPPPEEEHVDKELSGFMILEHDLIHGTVYIAVVMPWAISGDSFEATTILGEQAIQRIRQDLAETNHLRAQEQLPPFPALRCSWCTTPFRMGSRMTQSLTRRGFLFLEDFQKEYPGEVEATAFTREMMIPAPYVKALKIFVRRFESEADLGSTVAVAKKPRVRTRKRKADE
ncbi:hypothetical protein BCR35DRAFT_314909 [Leucosporidium creatinivorum]|uniref:Uncharacterized protein n=1 Tax=Leucosporidium creatinivorum TaxID=106004 RepID=A0A1Y2EQP2_9BASI|nr:hypothetical protein BCR35DRAFT_314909 [Leucosporidium creatinivorum]